MSEYHLRVISFHCIASVQGLVLELAFVVGTNSGQLTRDGNASENF